jgi:hypothetical protein
LQRSTISIVRRSASGLRGNNRSISSGGFRYLSAWRSRSKPTVVDGCIVPDAGDDVLKLPAARLVEENVVGDDRLHLELHRHVRKLMEPHLVVRPPPEQSERYALSPKISAIFRSWTAQVIARQIRHENADQAFRVALTSSRCRMQLFLPPRDFPSVMRRVSRE